MDRKRNIWAWMAIAYWITCIAWTSPIFSIDLTGLWWLKGEELHRYEHQVWTDYEDGSVEEREFDGKIEQPNFDVRGYATQFDGQIEAYLIGRRICGELFEMSFWATIAEDNQVEFTNTYPGGSERCHQGGAYWYFSWADVIGSYSGIYDPEKRIITGTFNCYQEWAYTECWENDPLFGYSHYSVESTNIITDGTFTISVKSARFIDKEDYSREVFGATADGASEVVIEAGPLPPDVVDASQVIVTIPDDGGELLDDAILHAGIFRQTWKAPEDFAGRVSNPELGKRKIDFQVYVNGVDLEAPEFNLYKPPVVLIHGLWSGPGELSEMENCLKLNYSPYGIYRLDYSQSNGCHFSSNVGYVGSQISNAIKEMKVIKEHDHEIPIVVKKADIVAHSMGGILSNLYVNSILYKDNVNRIITIGTPHCGSELANFALHFIYEEASENWQKKSLSISDILGMSLTHGAVEDLQVGSSAMINYQNSSQSIVPVRAIVAKHSEHIPSSPLWLLYESLWLWDRQLDPSTTYFNNDDGFVYSSFDRILKVEEGLYGSTYNSDFVVSLTSQSGGVSADGFSIVTDHMSETSDTGVLGEVVNALNSPIRFFDQGGFSPPSNYPLPPVGVFNASDNIGVLAFSGNDLRAPESGGSFIITSPTHGAVFEPGENIIVSVACDMEISGEVYFISQDLSMGSKSMAPYEFEFAVNKEYLGPMIIAAWAISESGSLEYDELEVNIVTNDILQEIAIIPFTSIYMKTGEQRMLYVEGSYSDGIVRNITFMPTTCYASSDPNIVEVSSSGILTAKSPGQATVTVENSELKKEVEIVVESPKAFLPTQLIDDFNDNTKDPKWDLHELDRDSCWLEETNQRLEFRSNPGAESLATYVSGSWRLIGTQDFAFRVKTHYTNRADKEGLLFVNLAPDIEDLGATFVQLSIGCDLAGPCFYYHALDRGEELQSARESRNIEDATLYVRYDAQGDQLHLSFSGSDKNDTWQTVPGLLRSFWECEQISVCIGGTASGAKLDSGETYFDDFVIETEDFVHASDSNCDYTVDDSELSEYTSQWLAGYVKAKNLLDAQSFWLAGHYYWDPANQIFKEGKKP